MKKLILLSLTIISFLTSCSKDDPQIPTESKDKIVEIEVIYGEKYANFGLNCTLQASSIEGLSNNFRIVGLDEDPQVNDPNSKIYNLSQDIIPAKSVKYKTSEKVSTLGIFFLLTNINPQFDTLPLKINFVIDGKITVTKDIVLKSTVDGFQGYTIDVSQPNKLIESAN